MQKKADLSETAKEIENEIKTENPANNQTALSAEGLEFVNQIRSMVNRLSNTNDTRSDL